MISKPYNHFNIKICIDFACNNAFLTTCIVHFSIKQPVSS